MRTLTAAVAFFLAMNASAQTARERWVEKTLASMSLDQKVGHLLIPYFPSGGFRGADSEEMKTARRNIAEFHVGGYHTLGGDPVAVATNMNELQRMAKLPLLITADLEGGPGYVIFGATRLPLAMAIGATGDEQLAFEAGKLAAVEGRAIGIHVNYYPVADVNNNARNPIINIRSFGEDPARVSAFVRAYIRGAQQHGQIATAKHFPGHGDVSVDSHLQLPTLDVDRARLDRVELPPFRAAIAEGVGAIMSAHIHMPAIEKEKGLPATLSRAALTDLLRGELGFRGLVFTDAMDMHALSGHTPEEATVRAVLAGADVVIFPRSVEASVRALKEAVAAGRLPETRLDESVRRILRAKYDVGLHRQRFADVSALNAVVASRGHRELATRIAENAVTLVRDEKSALPLRASNDLRVVQINVLDSRSGWREGPVGRVLTAELPKRFPRAVTVQVDDQTTAGEYDTIRKLASLADAVIVNAFIRVADSKGSIDLRPEQLAFIRALAKSPRPFVLTSFGSPYVLTAIPESPSYVVTYDTHPGAELAAVRAIAGEIAFRGRLPISLPGLYPVGHGMVGK